MFVFLFFVSSGYQLGCTIAAISAKWPAEHVKHAFENIVIERMPQTVVSVSLITGLECKSALRASMSGGAWEENSRWHKARRVDASLCDAVERLFPSPNP